MKNPVHFLRLITFVEAVSFLVLLGIAMPLKYVWHLPIAVLVAGSIHGILFVVFCAALLRTLLVAGWPFSRAVLVFVASFVPIVPFFLDRRLRVWENEYMATASSEAKN